MLLGAPLPVHAHYRRGKKRLAVLVAYRVNAHIYRVYGLPQLRNVLAHILLAHCLVVKAVEVGVKGDKHLLVVKLLAAERHVLVQRRLVAQVLELLTPKQTQIEVAVVLGKGYSCRVCQHNRRIVAPAAHIIYHHTLQHAGIGVLLLHKQVVARYLVIEHPLGDFHLGRFLLHRVQERPHLDLRVRQHIVLEEKCADGNARNQHYQRRHHLHQRDAGSLHGGKLELLAQVAESHQRGEQYGQRQRHGHHAHGGIEEQLPYHVDGKPLAHHVVDVFPQELHQHDEEHDEERHREQGQETLQYKCVQAFYQYHVCKTARQQPHAVSDPKVSHNSPLSEIFPQSAPFSPPPKQAARKREGDSGRIRALFSNFAVKSPSGLHDTRKPNKHEIL